MSTRPGSNADDVSPREPKLPGPSAPDWNGLPSWLVVERSAETLILVLLTAGADIPGRLRSRRWSGLSACTGRSWVAMRSSASASAVTKLLLGLGGLGDAVWARATAAAASSCVCSVLPGPRDERGRSTCGSRDETAAEGRHLVEEVLRRSRCPASMASRVVEVRRLRRWPS